MIGSRIALFRKLQGRRLLLSRLTFNCDQTTREMSKVPLRVSPVVSVDWLAEKLTSSASSNFAVLDCSWYMPIAKRNPRREFTQSHILGSQFFDIEQCSDEASDYDHMLPTPEMFADYVSKLGVSNQHHVVVYDTNENFGLFSAPRVWWMFRVFGHKAVSVLDGGFAHWVREGYATTDEATNLPPQHFKASYDSSLVKTYEEVVANLSEKSFTVVDGRSIGRFEGTAPEPRPGIKPGHMPDAANIPFNLMVNPNSKCVKTPDEIREVFKTAGVDLESPFVTSCGTGVSACVLALGAFMCGKEDVPVYDGSWMEWFKRAKPQHRISSDPYA